MIVEAGKTYIGKVRARSNERDTLALQLRLTSMLSATNLQPPGLPAVSIVCIRKFRDPLPGVLRVQRSGMRPPYAWEQAVSAALKQLVEHAAHPARGAVPPDAEAVIFADRAEMLACLASDWCEGNMLGCWWWQGLCGGKDIRAVWLDTPEYIPAALQHLATIGKVVPFVQALDAKDISAILKSLMYSFALYDLQSVHETIAKEPLQAEPVPQSTLPSLTSPTTRPEQETQEPGSFVTVQPTNTAASARQSQPVQEPQFRVTPWQPWVPEISSSNLRLEQQSLLGIGLMLVRAPIVVRTSAFAQAVLQWWRAEAFPLANAMPQVEKDSGPEDMVGQQHGQPHADHAEDTQGVSVLSEQRRDGTTELPFISDDKSSRATPAEGLSISTIEAIEAAESSGGGIQLPASEPVGLSPQVPGGSITKPIEERPALLPNLEPPLEVAPSSITGALPPTKNQEQTPVVGLLRANIETELGGLFYLINLGLFLNFYGDFTMPLQPGLSLSIWDFITLLGQQLLVQYPLTDRRNEENLTPLPKPPDIGDSNGTMPNMSSGFAPGTTMPVDPVWLFLAQLAGRSEQEPAGRDFTPPESWHVPAEWLTPFPERYTWRWDVNNGRLQVQHSERFLVLDLPLDEGDPAVQLMHEMQVFTDLWHEEVPLARGLVHLDEVPLVGAMYPQVKRWLYWLMPYVRVRLQRALGLANADDVARILCAHSARVFLTATHLDVVFSLAELPIEIRLSGIDRNPGWVPAAGRFIAFHFE